MAVFSDSSTVNTPFRKIPHQRTLMAERMVIIFSVAILVTAFQITFAVYWANHGGSFSEKFLSLHQFDSEWYEHIVENGYRLTNFPLEASGNTMAHVGFFPGYPIASWVLRSLTGLSTRLSLILTADFFTVGVWIYVLLFFRRYAVTWKLQALAILSIVAFPSAFFFVAGYSESLFVFTFLGYLYWITDDRPHAWILAAAHGFALSATRIVGIPLMILPIARYILHKRSLPASFSPYVVAVSTGLGAGIFFLYCQSVFGDWNIYSHAQSFGWNIDPDFGSVFDLRIYKIFVPSVSSDGFVNPGDVSMLSVPFIFIFSAAISGFHIINIARKPREYVTYDYIILSAAALCIFYITISGLYAVGFRSVIRYMLPAHILLVIIAASMLSRFEHWNLWVTRIAWGMFSVTIALFFFVQAGHIDLFTHGIWVA